MNRTTHISKAVLNGIKYLREEQMFGKGSAAALAAQHVRTAMIRDNQRAARYWHKVMVTIGTREQTTAPATVRSAA